MKSKKIYLINDKRNETNLLCNSDFAAGTRFEYHQGHFFGIGVDDEYSAFLPRGI